MGNRVPKMADPDAVKPVGGDDAGVSTKMLPRSAGWS